tara:strand:+ start:6443 stop:6613 length:171 start_codon:yes stop_codon:yes gene_type:complete
MLEKLYKTINTCIDYHSDNNNTVKVAQLSKHLEKASDNSLYSTSTTPDLYQDESKK